MSKADVLPFPKLFGHAEHELSAFLHAAVEIVGCAGIPDAAELWFHAMEEANCPGADPERFFREVTKQAVVHLAQASGGARSLAGSHVLCA